MKDEMLLKRYQQSRSFATAAAVGTGIVVGLCYAYVQNHVELVLKSHIMIGVWAALGVTFALFYAGALTGWLLCRFLLKCPACRKFAGLESNFCPKCATPLK